LSLLTYENPSFFRRKGLREKKKKNAIQNSRKRCGTWVQEKDENQGGVGADIRRLIGC